jgi:cytochrome c oxidase subunit III
VSAAQASDVAVDQRAVKGISSSILGMILFVASEAMFFAAFFGAYFTIYAAAPIWPPANIPIPQVTIASIATGLLVSSSITMQAAVYAAKNGLRRYLNLWLGATILLGIGFLVLQTIDYSNIGFSIHDGIYASLFYVMTSLHMAHVVGGVLFLILVFEQSRSGQLSVERHEPVTCAAIYWDFVDLVWIGLFLVFYILPQTANL